MSWLVMMLLLLLLLLLYVCLPGWGVMRTMMPQAMLENP